MAFAFYDFETTGTNPAFDQPLQFAAILTDEDFNEIDRVNLRCRLAPHILPSPIAMAITGVMPAMMTDSFLPSWFEFAELLQEQIRKWALSDQIGLRLTGLLRSLRR
jgi:exodeoxyribonuclease I